MRMPHHAGAPDAGGPYPVRMTRQRIRRSVVIAGSPTALGGHFAGMERGPAELRAARPARAARRAAGSGRDDVAATSATRRTIPAGRPIPTRGRRTGAAAATTCRGLAAHVADRAAPPARRHARLLVLGGDCTSHPGAMAGIRRARPGIRLGLAWFDAHGDFNTPDTTPSGNVWGMPFAMACGRGDPDLVAAVDGPTVREVDAGLFGGQVLDETESRMLAASPRRPLRRRDAGRRRRAGRGRRLERARSPAGSTAGTSRSTSTSSTAPRAGRWPCPNRTAWRSTRRSRRSGSSRGAAPGRRVRGDRGDDAGRRATSRRRSTPSPSWRRPPWARTRSRPG